MPRKAEAMVQITCTSPHQIGLTPYQWDSCSVAVVTAPIRRVELNVVGIKPTRLHAFWGTWNDAGAGSTAQVQSYELETL